ncbi:hypothetical protein T06_3638 [Trichinella sp. T6]|nr:hypothetical protein T06_3638 [Trichinella sp. T6]
MYIITNRRQGFLSIQDFLAIQDSVWSCPRRFVDARSVGQERQWKYEIPVLFVRFCFRAEHVQQHVRWNLSTRPLYCG